MDKNSKIYVAGHTGLIGSAIMRKLAGEGFKNIIARTHSDLDLTRQNEVENFFQEEKPDYVFLAAAKVGGIIANSTYPAEFIYDNLAIAFNIIHTSYKNNVKKLLNLGSSCIYPKLAPQPLKEEYLLTGALESTNEAYAVAKIAVIKLCRYYNEQYGTNYISAMPSNQYGIEDHFDFENSHVLPALLRKFFLARLLSEKRFDVIKKDLSIYGGSIKFENDGLIIKYLEKIGISDNPSSLTLWGTGSPYREFLYSEDLAGALLYIMEKYDYKDIGEFINIGSGQDIIIRDLAEIVKDITGFKGMIKWDSSKPDGTPKKVLDVSRLRLLGWNSKIGLKEGIEKVYNWYCDKLYC